MLRASSGLHFPLQTARTCGVVRKSSWSLVSSIFSASARTTSAMANAFRACSPSSRASYNSRGKSISSASFAAFSRWPMAASLSSSQRARTASILR